MSSAPEGVPLSLLEALSCPHTFLTRLIFKSCACRGVALRLLYPVLARRSLSRAGNERFCRGRRSASGVWFYAVSVGEAIAAAPLVRQMSTLPQPLPVTISLHDADRFRAVRKLFGAEGRPCYLPL